MPGASPDTSDVDASGVTVDSDPVTDVDLRRLRDLSYLLDDSIRLPGGYRIGIEPLIGLLPVVGDGVGLAISAYVFAVAARAGVPRATLGRVAVILWLDAVVGSVPLLGDLFDAYWKANLRTANLLDARVADPASAVADRRYLRRVAVVALALTLVVVAVVVALAWWAATRVGVIG
ncbi:DUF4112 domain-containing protein [Haloplanus natans]|uniref:DUF4112 domain-containing protein n=1 Tax=Haloplanus natans TaxID=376171 RepID=UPI000677D84E|nr:DUF4112 domain-containing protein [Haloplanus natans]